MKQSKIVISVKVLDAIAESSVLSGVEKLNFLKYVGYMSHGEQQELCSII
jgi:hypothetical protein